MMDMELLESRLAELPLLGYFSVDPKSIEFNDRIRWICENECPMCGQTWACPPAVGSVTLCKAKCRSYDNCLMIATITEVRTSPIWRRPWPPGLTMRRLPIRWRS